MKRSIAARSFAFSLALLLPLMALAAPVEIGQPLPELKLLDQREAPWELQAQTRLLLFAPGRKAGEIVQSVLAEQPSEWLATRQVMYVADLSRMPAMITRMFALPALRAEPFSVGVVLDEKLVSDWPRRADTVTLLRLHEGSVTAVDYASSAEELRAAIDRER